MNRTLATAVLVAAALLVGCGGDDAPEPVATADVPTTERVVAPQDDTDADAASANPTAGGAIRIALHQLCATPTTDGVADLVVLGETDLDAGTTLQAVYVVDIPAEGSPPSRRATAEVTDGGEVTFRIALYADDEQGSVQSVSIEDGSELLVDGDTIFNAERLVADEDAC